MRGASALFACAVFLASAHGSAYTRPPVAKKLPEISHDAGDFIESKIWFDDKKRPHVVYAQISDADPLSFCPLESMPLDIQTAVQQLVAKARDSVSKVKASRGDGCKQLQNRLESTTAQLGTAMQNQFIAARSISSTADQNLINAQTRQAAAINTMLLTASDMLQRECITMLDDKVVIQKLIGQVVMLSGLFMGGWQGLSIAAGGQLLGNLPLFRNDIDKALELFQRYEEINERGSFLCLFRQMQKLSVLLFANEDTQVLSGLDLSFSSGAVKTTLDSMRIIERETPELLQDIMMLRSIASNSDELMAEMQENDAINKESFTILPKMRRWCGNAKISALAARQMHVALARDSLASAVASLQGICDSLTSFSFRARAESEVSSLLLEAYWDLFTIRGYYAMLREDDGKLPRQSPIEPDAAPLEVGVAQDSNKIFEVCSTYESMQYFESLKRSMEQYRAPIGNQARLNYETLTRNIGTDLARTTFLSMMSNHYKTFNKTEFLDRSPIHDTALRQRTLWAMLDLCLTLDPTVTRLYIDAPEHSPLQKAWLTQCVGPKSNVCSAAMNAPDKTKLLSEPRYRVYFDSLCTGAQSKEPEVTWHFD